MEISAFGSLTICTSSKPGSAKRDKNARYFIAVLLSVLGFFSRDRITLNYLNFLRATAILRIWKFRSALINFAMSIRAKSEIERTARMILETEKRGSHLILSIIYLCENRRIYFSICFCEREPAWQLDSSYSWHRLVSWYRSFATG